MELEQTLASVPLLSSLDRRTIKRLAEQGKQRTYQPGDVIIREDAPASALYVITRGKVRVDKGVAADEPLTYLTPGDFFGELALIEDHPRSATITAVDETDCVLFVAWEFTALLKENPAIAVPIMYALIERLHRHEKESHSA
ncbi:MAG TPA: cyclic nucleotide-binding domain-containing protein [Candidatus Limnocylindria bacterium]|nr:cyclic nucleotide-binding domain-containing protein [Candidatus Limnocylindria bacterium]